MTGNIELLILYLTQVSGRERVMEFDGIEM